MESYCPEFDEYLKSLPEVTDEQLEAFDYPILIGCGGPDPQIDAIIHELNRRNQNKYGYGRCPRCDGYHGHNYGDCSFTRTVAEEVILKARLLDIPNRTVIAIFNHTKKEPVLCEECGSDEFTFIQTDFVPCIHCEKLTGFQLEWTADGILVKEKTDV